jgi:hypothetical protein
MQSRLIDTTIFRYILDLQLYIVLAVEVYAQDVDYFFIVLLLQICMFKDIDQTHKSHKASYVDRHDGVDCSTLFDKVFDSMCRLMHFRNVILLLYSIINQM